MTLPTGLAILVRLSDGNSDQGLVMQTRKHSLGIWPPEEVLFEISVRGDCSEGYHFLVSDDDEGRNFINLLARIDTPSDGAEPTAVYQHSLRVRHCHCCRNGNVSLRHSIFLVIKTGDRFQIEEINIERNLNDDFILEMRTLASGRVENGELAEAVFEYRFPTIDALIRLLGMVFDLHPDEELEPEAA